jgi:hypothetical protein
MGGSKNPPENPENGDPGRQITPQFQRKKNLYMIKK